MANQITLVQKVLISIIIVFLLLLTLIVLGLLYSNNNKFEWGSVSDWVSCFSSLLTTLIAYRVYKEAPKWIENKHNETGFEIATSLITRYDKHVQNIQKIHFDVIRSTISEKDRLDLKNDITVYIYDYFELSSDILSLKRWRISIPQEVVDSFGRISGYYNQATVLTITNSSWDERSNRVSEIENLLERILLDQKSLREKEFDEIFTFPIRK